MRPSFRLAGLTLLSSLAALVAADGLSGQQGVRYAELDHDHHQAMELAYAGGEANLRRAAWSHGHVAYLRPADDVERFECLRTQAQLLKSIGEVEGARYYLELAARQAEEIGDDYGAAMTYIDAGLLALEIDDASRAWQNAQSATVLATGGKMSAEQRREVQNRLGMR